MNSWVSLKFLITNFSSYPCCFSITVGNWILTVLFCLKIFKHFKKHICQTCKLSLLTYLLTYSLTHSLTPWHLNLKRWNILNLEVLELLNMNLATNAFSWILKSTFLISQVESHKTMCQFNSFVIVIFYTERNTTQWMQLSCWRPHWSHIWATQWQWYEDHFHFWNFFSHLSCITSHL